VPGIDAMASLAFTSITFDDGTAKAAVDCKNEHMLYVIVCVCVGEDSMP
jgi:hypothetical protein